MAAAARAALLLLALAGPATGAPAARTNIKIIQDRPAAPGMPSPSSGYGGYTGYTPPTPAFPSDDFECKAGSYLEVRFHMSDSADKLFGNAEGFMGFPVTAGDVFEYEMMWAGGGMAALDVEGYAYQDFRLRDTDIRDANGLSNHCEHAVLGARAVGKFYKRAFNLTSMVGKHVNNLVFSAAPGHGIDSTMILRNVAYHYTRDGVRHTNHIWHGGRKPFSVRTFQQGGISTHCLDPYEIGSNCTCFADGRGGDHGWRRHVDAMASQDVNVIPLTLGGAVTCKCNVSLYQGRMHELSQSDDPPRLEVQSMLIAVHHHKLSDSLPPVVEHNATTFAADGTPGPVEITPASPANLAVTHALESMCVPNLLLNIYRNSTATITLFMVDKATNEHVQRQVLDAPVFFTCGSGGLLGGGADEGATIVVDDAVAEATAAATKVAEPPAHAPVEATGGGAEVGMHAGEEEKETEKDAHDTHPHTKKDKKKKKKKKGHGHKDAVEDALPDPPASPPPPTDAVHMDDAGNMGPQKR